MKLKYYLRGCGVGILITVVIFMVAIKAKGGIMTDQKVMRRASELGMVMAENEQNVINMPSTVETQMHSDTQNALQTQTIPETQETGQITSEKKETGTSSKTPQAEEQKKPQEDKKEEGKESKKEIIISVNKGEVCRDVAERLYEEGLVEDSEEFRVYMGENGYAKNLCVGEFSLKKGMTYKEIAEVLTQK